MKISIFGLGYVGAVCGACLADRGHTIVGVDVSRMKVDLINSGRSPIVEPQLDELLAKAVAAGRFTATTDTRQAVADTELSMICVGTPSKKTGDLDLTYVESVCREIGEVLRDKPAWHTVVLRSTVLPGTVANVVVPALEKASGKKAGHDFGVAVNPEFLREGSAIKDFFVPAITVIGQLDPRSGDQLASIYEGLPGQIFRKPIEVAELVKYASNVWRAVKVTFGNEIGAIAKASGVDGREVMEIVCSDRQVNMGPSHMRPGFAFGGSCLPKDIRALTYRASQLHTVHPLLGSLMRSNQEQIQRAFQMVTAWGKKRIGLLGLSFKTGTDDLRESPLVELAEMLIGKGYDLRIYDRNVDFARVYGANKEYIGAHIPHVASLLKSDLAEVIDHAEVLIIGLGDPDFRAVIEQPRPGRKVIDLVGMMKSVSSEDTQGVCW